MSWVLFIFWIKGTFLFSTKVVAFLYQSISCRAETKKYKSLISFFFASEVLKPQSVCGFFCGHLFHKKKFTFLPTWISYDLTKMSVTLSLVLQKDFYRHFMFKIAHTRVGFSMVLLGLKSSNWKGLSCQNIESSLTFCKTNSWQKSLIFTPDTGKQSLNPIYCTVGGHFCVKAKNYTVKVLIKALWLF